MKVGLLTTETMEWDAFVHSVPQGSPFHLLAWRRVVETVYGHRPQYLMATRGNGLEGVLPLFETRGPLGGRALISVPYAVYGGICGTSPAARQALLEAARELGARLGAAYVELRHRPGQELDLPAKSRYVGFSRTISADDEANLDAIPRKQRRMIRQGAKHGLRAEFGLQHLDAFYDVYAHSVRNLGSPVFPRRLFHAIVREFRKDCELLTIWKDGRAVSGVLTLFFEAQVLPYYGGALASALGYAVNDFMYWELMCHAARSGYRVFDFGRSREGTGAYHFKRHWGFEPTPLPYQYVLFKGSMPDVSPSNPRMRHLIAAWQRTPLPMTKLIGPVLTKYLP